MDESILPFFFRVGLVGFSSSLAFRILSWINMAAFETWSIWCLKFPANHELGIEFWFFRAYRYKRIFGQRPLSPTRVFSSWSHVCPVECILCLKDTDETYVILDRQKFGCKPLKNILKSRVKLRVLCIQYVSLLLYYLRNTGVSYSLRRAVLGSRKSQTDSRDEAHLEVTDCISHRLLCTKFEGFNIS